MDRKIQGQIRRRLGLPAYDDMPEELKPILIREMETYAGFLEHTDYQIGRLIDTLDDLEALDDTLIYYRQRRLRRRNAEWLLQRDCCAQRYGRDRDP